MKKISILHTGGTISSKVNYKTGGVSAKFTAKDVLELYPEIKNLAIISSRLIRNMFSEDINFHHYNILAKEIEKESKNVDGIIITHGTDTIHYTSAALSFILENLPLPVILVGAQRSSDRGSSDAGLNLICASQFITKTDFAEVAICMHQNISDSFCYILPGLKTKKLHASRRDAFQPVNARPISTVTKDGKITFISKYKKAEKGKLKLNLLNPKLKIGIIRTHPHMFASEFSSYKDFNGLIIEGTGLGHAPINKIDTLTTENQKIFDEIKKLAKKMPVVMTSQTVFGRINMNVYSTGRELQEAGVLGNLHDMTTETAFIKVAYLLSNYKKQEIPFLISKNLKGEINPRIFPDEFLK